MLHSILLVMGGLLGRRSLVAGLRCQLVRVDGVGLLGVHLRQLVLELELQLLQQLDDAVGLEAVLFHVALGLKASDT